VRDVAKFEAGLKAVNVEEGDDGTLYIEGLAADFETDRDAEAFEPGAFQRGLDAYMANPVLMHVHRPDEQLGQVTEATLGAKGLHVKGEIPRPPDGTWAAHAYNLIKRGMMRGFSVGGAFKRHMTPDGPRIFEVDLQEISVAPIPVNPRTLYGVAGKAFGEDPDAIEVDARLTSVSEHFADALERVS